MAAAAILEKFQMAISPQPVVYLRNGSRSTYSAHRAVIFAIAQLSCKKVWIPRFKITSQNERLNACVSRYATSRECLIDGNENWKGNGNCSPELHMVSAWSRGTRSAVIVTRWATRRLCDSIYTWQGEAVGRWQRAFSELWLVEEHNQQCITETVTMNKLNIMRIVLSVL